MAEAWPGELAQLRDLVKKYNVINNPFICGYAAPKKPGTLPDEILVCPAMGSDIIAVYRRVTPESSPEY